MSMKSILVPLDGSPLAEAILPPVRRLAAMTKAEIVLLRAYHLESLGGLYVALLPEFRREAEDYLRTQELSLSRQGVRVRTMLVEAPAAQAILDAARTESPWMIAMTTHGRTGLERWALGSVTEKVIRAGEVPVLAIRSFPPAARELPLRKIVVPTDGSPASLAVVPLIAEFGRPLDAHVELLHIQEVSDPAMAARWTPGGTITEARDRLTAAAIPTTIVSRPGDPASEILSSGADLVAMSTHGRSGPARWALGSVTEKVLRAAPFPLLVVRTPKG